MEYKLGHLFELTPAWVSSLLLLALLMLAEEAGYRLARKRRARGTNSNDSDLSTVQAGVLGLLGLLLGFTYAFVVTRADMRKQAVVSEANNIGTAYLRAGLMPSPGGAQLQAVLREYLDSRILVDEINGDPVKLRDAMDASERIQAKIWPLGAQLIAGRTPTMIDALLIQALNDVLDIHTVRVAAGRDRLPALVLVLLFAVSIGAMTLCGLAAEVAGGRHIWRNSMVAVLIVAVVLIILDEDRSNTGMIRVSQESLVDLKRSFEQAPEVDTTHPASNKPSSDRPG